MQQIEVYTLHDAMNLYNKVDSLVNGMLSMNIIRLYDNNPENDHRPPITKLYQYVKRELKYTREINGVQRHGILSMGLYPNENTNVSISITHKCLD
jgi:hypothetical protein